MCASNGAILLLVVFVVAPCRERGPQRSLPVPGFLRRGGPDIQLDARHAQGAVEDEGVEGDVQVTHRERDRFDQGFLVAVPDVHEASDTNGQVREYGDHREGEVGLDAAVVTPNLAMTVIHCDNTGGGGVGWAL